MNVEYRISNFEVGERLTFDAACRTSSFDIQYSIFDIRLSFRERIMPKRTRSKTTRAKRAAPRARPQVFNMSLIQRGARLRRSPYFDATLRSGCRGYTVYNHMLLPIAYDDLEAEYWKLLSDVTVWDVAVERQVEITGRDALPFANLLTPRDLSKCAVGQGKYVVITAEDGGIINDPVLMRLGENHFWLALADSDVLLWAKGVAYRSGLDITIREPDVSPMQIQGPKSKPVLEKLFGPRGSTERDRPATTRPTAKEAEVATSRLAAADGSSVREEDGSIE